MRPALLLGSCLTPERNADVHRSIRTRAAGTLSLCLLLATLVTGPAAATGRVPLVPAAAPRQQSADLAPTLAADGTFTGAPGLAGTVDAGAWTLVSDLAAGEPPRFAPAANTVTPAAAGSWSALGSNGAGDGALNERLAALAVSGADLYVGGNFTDAAGIAAADYVAKWDGSNWSALGNNGAGVGALDGPVWALAVSGTNTYVGGNFTDAAGIATADFIAKWDGSNWSALGSNGAAGALNGDVYALAVSGPDLYVGGEFTDAADILEADRVARWDGSRWSALGNKGRGIGVLDWGMVIALAVSGTDLYVGGSFFDAAGIATADNIAMWDGSNWSALGSNGAGDGALNNPVHALAVSGTDLYVGGGFNNAAGIPTADGVARWNGSNWSALGSNGAGDGALNGNYVYAALVFALAVSGSDLYVGGVFTDAAGIATVDRIARWDGSNWSALGSNGAGDGALNDMVFALAISCSDLYVGGWFTNAAGIATADRVAAWGLGTMCQPDGRIRKGSGAFIGNNVYNTTGSDQAKTGAALRGSTITFGISVQNDGTVSDRFTLRATGTYTVDYTVKYLRGTTDITAAIVAGTYTTPALAPGATYLIKAKVTVTSTATKFSSVTRLVTITSLGDSSKKDAVKFIRGRP
jgi:hypothetical protein